MNICKSVLENLSSNMHEDFLQVTDSPRILNFECSLLHDEPIPQKITGIIIDHIWRCLSYKKMHCIVV